MQIRLLRSKIHRALFTDANVEYEGSLTINPDLMAKVHLGQAGDRLTIMTFDLFDEKSAPNHKPRVIVLGENNATKEERNIG